VSLHTAKPCGHGSVLAPRCGGNPKVGGPRLAGLCRVASLCRVLNGPTVVAFIMSCVFQAHHRGQAVYRVLAWPGTRQSLCLPCYWPAWHTADGSALFSGSEGGKHAKALALTSHLCASSNSESGAQSNSANPQHAPIPVGGMTPGRVKRL
jgi:hypothetical protein